MSKVNLTIEQKKAISLRDKNIIVSAQAGAGKTHILVERIINLLDEERIDIDSMLIVTFTNKAAAEMKDRIRSKLLDKIGVSTGSDSLYFQKQYNRISNANISTMHAFCIKILREYFYKLGLNPRFKLINDSTAEVLKWKSINETFESYYRDEDEKFAKLILDYSKRYDDIDVIDILFQIYRFINSKINPFEWLEEHTQKYKYKDYYEDKNNLEKLENEIFDYYKKDIDELIRNYEKASEEINTIYEATGCPAYQKTLNNDLVIIDKLRNINSLEEIKDFSENLSFANLETLTKVIKENFDAELIGELKSKVNSYRDVVKKYFKKSTIVLSREIEIQNHIRNNLDIISELLKDFDERYTKAKKKINSLDFNDLEHLTINLLDDEEVVENLKNRFNYIFFDEYQDANQVQDYIIDKIARKTNSFFVGDIKQSIYKFRLADPYLFKNRYSKYNTELEDNIAIDLKHNFRSEKNLLDFNNMIFNNIMTEEIGDVDYDQEAHRLQAGKSDYSLNSKVSINYIESDSKNRADLDVTNETFRYNHEAFYVAKKIKELVSNGKRYKDIVVLSRTATILEDISEFLELYNIPYYSDSSNFSFEDVELKVFIELLKAVNNDTEDITLITALKSTISNLTDEELAIIRGDNKDTSFNYCFRNFADELDVVERHEELINKINFYNNTISRYRQLEHHMSISDLAWYIFVDSGHMSYILSKDNGNRILDNIKLFIDEIKEYEENSYQTLSSFLNYVDRLKSRNTIDREPSSELSEEDDVVRLMTIHKSKGLQFDTIILPNLSRKFNTRDLSGNIILNDTHGISLKVPNEDFSEFEASFYENKIIDAKRQELFSEEIRILYVALTRAISDIYLVSKYDNELKDESYKDLYNIKSFSEWINYALFKDENLKNQILSISIDESKEFEYKNINFEVNNISSSRLYEEIEDISKKTTNLKFELDKVVNDEELKDVLNFTYDDELVDIPFKKTVTQISEKNNNISSDFKDYDKIYEVTEKININLKPKYIGEYEEVYDSMTIGTLYHYIFEKLPYTLKDEKDIEDYMHFLLLNSFISEKDYEQIDISLISNYINSPLYERIANSYYHVKEETFSMRYDDFGNKILVDGQIDLYFEENDGLVIVDFKTNRTINPDIYENQLKLYKDGLEKSTRKKVKELIIYWIMHNEVSKI